MVEGTLIHHLQCSRFHSSGDAQPAEATHASTVGSAELPGRIASHTTSGCEPDGHAMHRFIHERRALQVNGKLGRLAISTAICSYAPLHPRATSAGCGEGKIREIHLDLAVPYFGLLDEQSLPLGFNFRHSRISGPVVCQRQFQVWLASQGIPKEPLCVGDNGIRGIVVRARVQISRLRILQQLL